MMFVTVRLLKNANFGLSRDLDPTSIERPVMKSTERKSVPDVVTTVLAPWIDMRGFDFRCSIW